MQSASIHTLDKNHSRLNSLRRTFKIVANQSARLEMDVVAPLVEQGWYETEGPTLAQLSRRIEINKLARHHRGCATRQGYSRVFRYWYANPRSAWRTAPANSSRCTTLRHPEMTDYVTVAFSPPKDRVPVLITNFSGIAIFAPRSSDTLIDPLDYAPSFNGEGNVFFTPGGNRREFPHSWSYSKSKCVLEAEGQVRHPGRDAGITYFFAGKFYSFLLPDLGIPETCNVYTVLRAQTFA